MVSDWKLELIP